MPLFNKRGGVKSKLFLEKIISQDLSELKDTFQIFAKIAIFPRSLFKMALVSVGFGPNESKEMSSALIKTSDSRSFWMSFMYNMNSKGPNLDP